METPISRIGELTQSVIEDITQREKDTLRGLPTGFDELDRMLSGLNPGNLIIIAGHPGIGTTAFALRIAEHLSIDHNLPVVYLSMELEKEKLVSRMLAGRSGVGLRKANCGTLKQIELDLLHKAACEFENKPLYFDDTNRLSLSEICEKIEFCHKSYGIRCAIIDSLQLMKHHGRIELTETDYAEIAKGLKLLALKLDIPVILSVHLNFDLFHEGEENCVPRMADFGQAIIVERYTDVLMLIDRHNYYGSCPPDDNLVDLLIKKNRNGPTGMAGLVFNADNGRFGNISMKH